MIARQNPRNVERDSRRDDQPPESVVDATRAPVAAPPRTRDNVPEDGEVVVQAPPPHTDAYMDMQTRRATWAWFQQASAWFLLHTLMIVGYAVFVFAVGADWFASLIAVALLGFISGRLLKLGWTWDAFVGLFVVGVVAIRILVAFGSALLASSA